MVKFLLNTKYVDFDAPIIAEKAAELFDGIGGVDGDILKARTAYEFVRDEIPHSFDIGATVITAKASDVLRHRTGICHAKANLLAALLRSQGIATGFCFQRLTLAEDDSNGHCVHCFNAGFLDGRWVKLDARGNKKGVNAHFSLNAPILAFTNRPQFGEYFWPGIYAEPHSETMRVLETAASLQDVLGGLPDAVEDEPDLT